MAEPTESDAAGPVPVQQSITAVGTARDAAGQQYVVVQVQVMLLPEHAAAIAEQLAVNALECRSGIVVAGPGIPT
jgi:hypothetical protein